MPFCKIHSPDLRCQYISGSNAKFKLKTNINNNEINIICGECGQIMKIPYIREKKLKRRAKIDSYTFKKRDYE